MLKYLSIVHGFMWFSEWHNIWLKISLKSYMYGTGQELKPSRPVHWEACFIFSSGEKHPLSKGDERDVWISENEGANQSTLALFILISQTNCPGISRLLPKMTNAAGNLLLVYLFVIVTLFIWSFKGYSTAHDTRTRAPHKSPRHRRHKL